MRNISVLDINTAFVDRRFRVHRLFFYSSKMFLGLREKCGRIVAGTHVFLPQCSVAVFLKE